MKTDKLFSLVGVVFMSSFAFGEEADNVNAWQDNLINQVEKETSYSGVDFSDSTKVAADQQVNWLTKWAKSYAHVQKRLQALRSLKVGLSVLKSVEANQKKLAIKDFGALKSVQEKLSILESMEESPETLPLIVENLRDVNIAEDDFKALKSLDNYMQVLIRAGRSPEEVKFFEESPDAIQLIRTYHDQLGFALRELRSLESLKNILNVLKCSVSDLKALIAIKKNFDTLKSTQEKNETLWSQVEMSGKLAISMQDLTMLLQHANSYRRLCGRIIGVERLRILQPDRVKSYDEYTQKLAAGNFFVRLGWPSIELVTELSSTVYDKILRPNPNFKGY